jgi:hypothetical protein
VRRGFTHEERVKYMRGRGWDVVKMRDSVMFESWIVDQNGMIIVSDIYV